MPERNDGIRILLVDDDADDRLLAVRQLSREIPGAKIEEAGDRAGLDRAIENGGFDAVVTDYQLGWSDGLAVLREIRERAPECPVIMFTGKLSEEFAVEAMKAGLTDYVIKDPARMVRLPSVVLQAVEHARQRRATRDAEEARKRSEAQFRALIEHGSDVISVLGADGMILYGSPSVARVLGHDFAEFVGRSAFEFMHPDDLANAQGVLGKLLETPGGTTSIECRFRHRDGSWRLLDATAVNTLDDPAVRGIIATARDLTERRRAEDALRVSEEQFRQAQKMEAVGRLAGGVAHDFNNLLTAITCFNDIVRMSLREDDPLREHAEEIRKAVERASALTRQLLAFSRRQVMQPRIVDLNAVVADMEAMLRRILGEDVELGFVPASPLGKVSADPGQIEQVIMNLAVNARDAMPNGGRLTLETANVDVDQTYAGFHEPMKTGVYVRLTVSDTGSGMEEATRARLFEPFFTTKERGKGTGLGLSTVYGIVKQSQGYIWVYSEPGRGTTFKIYLPRVEGAAEAAPARPAEPALRSGGETILVVEDDEMVRLPVIAVLRSGGYTVLDAASGEAALELCRNWKAPVDLVLSDLVMPGMSGCDVAAALAVIRPRTRVLFTSGYTDHAVVDRGILDPRTPFLQKPFSPDALLRKVREVLDGQ